MNKLNIYKQIIDYNSSCQRQQVVEMDVLAISVADILVDGFGLGLDCTADEVQVNCTVQ